MQSMSYLEDNVEIYDSHVQVISATGQVDFSFSIGLM